MVHGTWDEICTNLAVALGSALAQSLSSLSSARHVCWLWLLTSARVAERTLGRAHLKRRDRSPFFQQGQDEGQIGQVKERHAQAKMTDKSITRRRGVSCLIYPCTIIGTKALVEGAFCLARFHPRLSASFGPVVRTASGRGKVKSRLRPCPGVRLKATTTSSKNGTHQANRTQVHGRQGPPQAARHKQIKASGAQHCQVHNV